MLLTACEKGLVDGVLTKLTVTALDQNDNIVKEKVFENVPVTRNQVTRYTGSFFGSGGGQTSDGTFRLTAARRRACSLKNVYVGEGRHIRMVNIL